MKKNIAMQAWYGCITGVALVSVTVPFLIKPPVATTDPALWVVAIGFVCALICIPFIVYFKNTVVANDDLELAKFIHTWGMVAFLPYGVGVFHYVKTGQLWFYVIAALTSCIVMYLLKPAPQNA